MLTLERFIPPFPLELERIGPDARITTLKQSNLPHVLAVVGPPGEDGMAGPQGPVGPASSTDDGFY